ncbi:hypothetical protein [Fischerella thermalis]|nr:hypothetical protein [Fischerella thermalis]
MSSFIQKKTNSPTSTDTSTIQETQHYQIVIVGGGAAGITVASQLCAKK